MRREGLAVGLFFAAAGVLFLLDALEVVSVRASYLWPLLLIGFGVALIAGGRRRPEPEPEPRPPKEPTPTPPEEPPEDRTRAEHRDEPTGERQPLPSEEERKDE